MSAKKTNSSKKHTNDSKKPDKLQQQIRELTEALQRERADAENIRRRAENDRIDALATGREIAIGQLLPLFDNLERAFSHMPKELENNKWATGIQSLDSQLRTIMKDFGLEPIDTVGKEFDPERMEAVSVEEGGDGTEIVSEELQKGYTLNGKLIRVAMVKVKR